MKRDRIRQKKRRTYLEHAGICWYVPGNMKVKFPLWWWKRKKEFYIYHYFQFIKIIAVCILSFGTSLFLQNNEFVYDDGVAIVQNDDVVNTKNRTIFDSLQSIMQHDFWGQNISDIKSHKSYRPLTTLFYHLEYRFLNAPNLAAYMKRINLLVHIGTCCIIYDIMRRVLYDCHYSLISNAVLLFAAHPIHTEVVCSVVGRSDLLCAFFFFATIGQYLDIIDEHEKMGRINWPKMVILFDAALISLLCKEIGIMVLVCIREHFRFLQS